MKSIVNIPEILDQHFNWIKATFPESKEKNRQKPTPCNLWNKTGFKTSSWFWSYSIPKKEQSYRRREQRCSWHICRLVPEKSKSFDLNSPYRGWTNDPSKISNPTARRITAASTSTIVRINTHKSRRSYPPRRGATRQSTFTPNHIIRFR